MLPRVIRVTRGLSCVAPRDRVTASQQAKGTSKSEEMLWQVWVLVTPVAVFAVLFLPTILQSRRTRRKARQNGLRIIPESGSGPVKLMVVLGSGGHTAEMLAIVWDILNNSSTSNLIITEIVYLITYGDTHSARKAQEMHATFHGGGGVKYRGIVLPRARSVGQSYVTSVISTMKSFRKALPVLLREEPSLILLNGPGTCVPVALCAIFARALMRTSIRIVYIESVARVRTFSLSGKLLYPVVDRFLVQWPQLQETYDLAEYYGRLC